MGKQSRFQGNLMTWVRPSNNKLIDRAIRYSQLLLEEKKFSASYENLSSSMLYHFGAGKVWNKSLVMEIVRKIEEETQSLDKSV